MKKILPAILVSSLFLAPVAALASTVTLAPTSVATVAGKTFSVTVGVNPTSGKAYTVRANLSFDPAAVTFTGFSFAPKWMQLPQAGYDVEDNAGGALAKTGGYPGGITSATVLGTATFRAKTTGTTNITATAESLILDAGNKNTVAGNQGVVQVSIAAAPAVSPATTAPSTTAVDTTVATETATATTGETAEVTQAAAVALSPLDSILSLGTGSPAVASLVTLIVLLVVGGGIWLLRREKADF